MHVDDEVQGQDDEFLSAFNERSSGGAPADEAREPEKRDEDQAGSDEEPAVKGGADEAPTEAAKDPWAGASPEMLKARDDLAAERDRFKHSDQSQRGRIAALQRQIDSARSQPQQPQEEREQGGQDESEAQQKADRLKQLREDYPDLAGPMLDLLDETNKRIESLNGRVSPVIDANDEAAVKAQLDVLGKAHPDWQAVAVDDSFRGWLAAQPTNVQNLANSANAAEVSTVLSAFKRERDESKAPEAKSEGNAEGEQEQQRDDRRARQLEGGRDRPSRAAPATAGPGNDFDGAFEHFAKKAKAK